MMDKNKEKKLILIDGSSYLFRAYYALPPLTTSSGQPTGAIYGVISMIKKLMKEHASAYIAVVFDPKGKTFRHQLYSAYKANRAEMPNELREQIAPLHVLIKAMGLPLIIKDGVEADDVIGTLTTQATKQGFATVISTMDKDMAQLVNDKVTLINTMSDRTLNIAGVQEKFGVTPEQIIDYLALIGDTSDNVPGVPKVGPKTAAKWLEEYKTLDNLMQHAEEIKGKVGENLRAHFDTLSLSKKLVTIQCDVALDCTIDDLTVGAQDQEQLQKLFTELEFTKWLESVQRDVPPSDVVSKRYTAIQDQKALDVFLKKCELVQEIALDTETTGLDVMRAELVGVSLCIEKENAVYIPLAHVTGKQLNQQSVLKQLTPLLQDKNKKLIGQNLKYDYKMLKRSGVEIKALMQDTMLESYVLNSTASRHDLDTLSLKYLGKSTITFEEVAGKGAKQVTFDHVPIPVATEYAAEDADMAFQLHQVLWKKIIKEKSFQKVLTEIEWPLMPILANMEYHGVLVDCNLLKKQSVDLQERIQSLESNIYAMASETFNISSPKQLQEILFEKLKLPIVKKTPTGAPSTAEEAMQELALEYELPKYIVDFRRLSKLKSTYTDVLPQQVNPETNRVHTSYNQAITSTGRLSSNNPNLQNIPVRTDEGRKIRQAFIAPQGYKIISADYSQIELRIMAHLSKDPGLLKAFANGWDVHTATAAEVFGVDLKEVTSEMRRRAKAINFGLLYGMSAFGLAKQLSVGREQAQQYMDVYFARYPNVHIYMETAREQAAKQGFVETLFGRRLFVPDINASNHLRRMAAERAAINAPLQGTAADIIKCAMICVDREFKKTKLPATMIMQVHDELIFEAKKDQVAAVCEIIKHCMENALKIEVPLEVAIGAGDNWDEAH